MVFLANEDLHLLVLAPCQDLASDLGVGPRESVRCKEPLIVKLACLRNVLPEAGVAASLAVGGEEQSANVRLLDEHLARACQLLEVMKQLQERQPEADAFQLIQTDLESIKVCRHRP